MMNKNDVRAGSGGSNPAHLITPCPAAIDQYFTEQLRYSKLTPKTNNKEPYVAIYSKVLSQRDNPLFPSLAGNRYISYIVVDLYQGVILNHYFEIRDKDKNKQRFNTFQECPSDNAVQWVFKWHVNLVHMSREYLKGGWLYRNTRKHEVSSVQETCNILTDIDFKNILEKAKPDSTLGA